MRGFNVDFIEPLIFLIFRLRIAAYDCDVNVIAKFSTITRYLFKVYFLLFAICCSFTFLFLTLIYKKYICSVLIYVCIVFISGLETKGKTDFSLQA